jgi:hypothetical protein
MAIILGYPCRLSGWDSPLSSPLRRLVVLKGVGAKRGSSAPPRPNTPPWHLEMLVPGDAQVGSVCTCTPGGERLPGRHVTA